MNKIDITLRDIIQNIPIKFIELLVGKKAVKILDNTFPSVKERKADIVLELEDGSILHIEIQTYPDKNMPYRMLEYYIMLKRRYKDRQIIQIVLYIGNGKPRMKNTIKENNIQYTYLLKDIKEIECKELMESQNIEDKILAVLCKVEDFEKYILNLVDYLMRLPEKERGDYIRKLLIALDYRPKLKERLSLMMEERKMPLTITQEMIQQDPFYKKGLEKGIKQGLEKGIKQGLEKGIKQGLEKGIKQGLKKGKILALQESVLRLIDRKFGQIPEELREKILNLTDERELNTLFDTVLNTNSIQELIETLKR